MKKGGSGYQGYHGSLPAGIGAGGKTVTEGSGNSGKQRRRKTVPVGNGDSGKRRHWAAGFPASSESPLPGWQTGFPPDRGLPAGLAGSQENRQGGKKFPPCHVSIPELFLMECRRIFPPVRGIVSLKEGFVLLFSKLVLSLFYTIIDLPFTLTTSPCPNKAQRV
jgi:hypothetical protein